MPRLKTPLSIMFPVLMLVTAPTLRPQPPASRVTVDGTTYNVTPMGGFLRVDDLDGHIVGMARKDGTIIAPQSGAGFDTVKAAVSAYTHPANGAAASGNPAPDPRAGNPSPEKVPGGDTPAGADRTVTLLPGGGAVVHDPNLKADVTFNADGTRAEFARQSQGPMGAVSQTITAMFEGGDKASSGADKAGKFVKGAAVAVLQAGNTHTTSHIGMDGKDVWKVSQKTNGGKEATLYESGAYAVGSAYAARVQDPGKTLGLSVLQSVKADRDAIEKAAEAAKQAGQPAQVDFSGDRSQRAKASLDKAAQ